LAYAEVLRDEQSVTVAGFLRRAVVWFARRGVHAQRVLSDNGSAYRSRLVAAACQALTLDHRFTRPYTPRTNGKAERFIQTLLREWAYAVAYPSSAHRTAALHRWLQYYYWHRPHTALHRQPPVSRVVGRDDVTMC
jgi:transposase InsO family protein